ncbi:MAG: hypothetical protein KKH29_05695 [Candidatus Omnitrophica bacterium]|nr:hypothetical protein [Candidatus Omnitrophota bacterium]MBU4346796.1 hypothetical protein [Candidatus Omnitrophota bacterium]MBU4472877.1 hypothetical protein [Candidatus Omnitrophota bacterium]MCG2706111.1 hypothetical protein [Candidatus Omnitrophota bacterium]
MKKVAVIIQAKDADSCLKTLRRLGVLHVEHQQLPRGSDISLLQDDLALISQAMAILSASGYSQKQPGRGNKTLKDWKFTAQHIIDAHKRIERLDEYSRSMQNSINQWQAWGDFQPEILGDLAKENIYIRFYSIPVKQVKEFPRDVIVKRISTVRGVAYCAVVSQGKVEIPFKEALLPKMGLSQMRARLTEDMQIMQLIKEDIRSHTTLQTDFLRIKKDIQVQLEFQEALRGMGVADEIMYLRGYIPYDKISPLQQAAVRERWGIMIKDPADEDGVPTLIRNPRWVAIISPIFKMIEVVPGYREFDISLWVLIFLSVFFGMLIGDAAYGAIFLSLTFLAQNKWGHKVSSKSIFMLLYLFSFCAIAWGVLSGTFFGQEWLPKTIQPLMPALRDSRNIQVFCFALGALHLSIAHLWRAIVKAPSLTVLSELGWVSVLWGAFFLAKALILGDIFPEPAKWFFIVGPFLVVFFTSIKKNVFKGIGQGLGNLFLNLVNSFTDVVSYIRLFAVGLATVVVADSFNRMAMDVGFGSILTGALTVLILFLGHALNILLGSMAVLVHGVRLNVLEFCNHIDVKWSGFSYKPLQEV